MDESQVICTIQDLKKQQVKQQQQRQILNNFSEKENWTSESEENDDSEEQCQSGTIPSSPVGLVSSPSFTSNSPNSHISFEYEALKSQLLSFLKNSSMTDWLVFLNYFFLLLDFLLIFFLLFLSDFLFDFLFDFFLIFFLLIFFSFLILFFFFSF